MNGWHPRRGRELIEQALAAFDFDRVAELIGQLITHLRRNEIDYPEDEAELLLTALRRSRQFRLLRLAAEALMQAGHGTPGVRIEYAQALIEMRALTAARAVLEDVLQSQPPGDAKGTAHGLLGRLFKQQYIDARHPKVAANGLAMRSAMRAYFDFYEQDRTDRDRWWHGANAIALAVRARKDGIELEKPFDIELEATKLIAAIRKADGKGDAKLWAFACAMEACLALKDPGPASGWAEKYLKDEKIRPFEIASTLGQLESVWGLSAKDGIGERLIPMLEAKLLSLRGTRLELDAGEAGSERRVPSANDGLMDADVYLLGLSRTRAIARIVPDDARSALKINGTGVLVRSADLHHSFKEPIVLLTCAHVVTDKTRASWGSSMSASEASIEFRFGREEGQEPLRTKIKEVLWQSNAVDACVVTLENLPANVEPCPVRTLNEAEDAALDRVFIAGYPVGQSLKFSLYDNLIIDRNERLLQYRAATKVGSSGSPVFDLQWQMVALHQDGGSMLDLKGIGVRTANQGTRISAIIAAIARDLSPG